MTNSKDKETVIRTEADRPKRPTRVPLGVPKLGLEVPYQIPGYHLHVINDEGGRLYEAERGGYEFVVPKEVGFEEKESRVRFLVGRHEDNSGMYAYLMKIRQEYYDEDQAALQKQVDAFDQAIRRGDVDGEHKGTRYDKGIKYFN